jgi:hypothetical protein
MLILRSADLYMVSFMGQFSLVSAMPVRIAPSLPLSLKLLHYFFEGFTHKTQIHRSHTHTHTHTHTHELSLSLSPSHTHTHKTFLSRRYVKESDGGNGRAHLDSSASEGTRENGQHDNGHGEFKRAESADRHLEPPPSVDDDDSDVKISGEFNCESSTRLPASRFACWFFPLIFSPSSHVGMAEMMLHEYILLLYHEYI